MNETDNNSDEATPVPIPNTAVKLVRVDGIGTQFGAERVDRCRSHPSLFSFYKGLYFNQYRPFLINNTTHHSPCVSKREFSLYSKGAKEGYLVEGAEIGGRTGTGDFLSEWKRGKIVLNMQKETNS